MPLGRIKFQLFAVSAQLRHTGCTCLMKFGLQLCHDIILSRSSVIFGTVDQFLTVLRPGFRGGGVFTICLVIYTQIRTHTRGLSQNCINGWEKLIIISEFHPKVHVVERCGLFFYLWIEFFFSWLSTLKRGFN